MYPELNPAQRRDEVHALLKLIASSANNAVAIWEQHAGSVPSLDEAKVDGSCASNTDLLHAVRQLEGASYQLCATLAPTFLTLHTTASAPVEAACLRVAVEAKIPGILADHPNGLHVTEIAKQTGLPSAKLSRILRILSVKHCFREVKKDAFANNRLSLALHPSTPLADLIHVYGTLCNPFAWTNFYEALMDPANGPSEEPMVSAFSWAAKDTFFGWLHKRPEESERFGRAMTALQLGAVHELYPIGCLPVNTTWCDVGGGVGGMLLPIAEAHPHIQLTLQDQPHVLEEAKDHFEQHCPAALQENRISFVPIDFLKESPVPDQDFYYMRMIIHDWPDLACIQILTNIRKVMKSSSRLLIQEYVLTDSIAEITDTGAGTPPPSVPDTVSIDAPKPLPQRTSAEFPDPEKPGKRHM
ncbi:S-adenosyl-L-methionine-dependent methyltransferase [Dentipellis sp. KUC8613]|nr:S-adenosyl-L-methionine-dependent methyltransferase [Dentipellis sp. KUC8613]